MLMNSAPSSVELSRRNRVIMVSGCPRSGTTWVGRVLATAPDTAYVLEPFNLVRADMFQLPLTHWYQRVEGADADEIEGRFNDIFAGKVTAPSDVRWVDYVCHPLTAARQSFAWHRDRWKARHAQRFIVKDPIALLSAEWFHDAFDATPILTVRHPAAVVSSIMLKGWKPDYRDLFQQESVVGDFFANDPIVDEPESYHPANVLENACQLWRLLHKVILAYRVRHPDWVVVRHEDLSARPTTAFAELFSQLDVPYNQSTQDYVVRSTTGNHAPHASIPTNDVQRDSRRAVTVWKERLSADEIARIRRLTDDVACQFYDDDEW